MGEDKAHSGGRSSRCESVCMGRESQEAGRLVNNDKHYVGFMLFHRHLLWLIIGEKRPAVHCAGATPLCLTFLCVFLMLIHRLPLPHARGAVSHCVYQLQMEFSIPQVKETTCLSLESYNTYKTRRTNNKIRASPLYTSVEIYILLADCFSFI